MIHLRMDEDNGQLEILRTTMKKSMRVGSKTPLAEESFTWDAGKLLNQAPKDIERSTNFSSSKAKHKQSNSEPEERTEKIEGRTCDYTV